MKAIMIVDIPDNCNKSLLSKHLVSITFNHGTYKTLLYAEGYLKPLPEKAKYTFKKTSMWWGICKGWNACIDEILGDTE